MLTRRSLLLGLGASLAAPALVRAGSLMQLPRRRLVLPAPFELAENITWTASSGEFGTATYFYVYGSFRDRVERSWTGSNLVQISLN